MKTINDIRPVSDVSVLTFTAERLADGCDATLAYCYAACIDWSPFVSLSIDQQCLVRTNSSGCGPTRQSWVNRATFMFSIPLHVPR